jgi:Helix-turn-helix domain
MTSRNLTTSEVATRFGVTRQAVRLWCDRKLFPNAKQEESPRGSYWSIPESDLVGFKPPKPTGRPPKPKEDKASVMDGKVSVKGSKK